jgi:hypothetical protein
MQFIASIRREDYYKLVQAKPISANRANPNNPSFDAERAVAYHVQHGNVDEAAWLVFLMTQFARPAETGWQRLQDVYGCLGQGIWDWRTVSANPKSFFKWIATNWQNIRGKFGNHRKYESLRPDSNRPFAKIVQGYLDWIGGHGHQNKFGQLVRQAGNNPETIFDKFYRDLDVPTFGRLAKFDYLSLLDRYHLFPGVPGSAYLNGATGPTRGAKLLIDGSVNGATSRKNLQMVLTDLDATLNVGMQVMEDALCNWQKSPNRFIHFEG